VVHTIPLCGRDGAICCRRLRRDCRAAAQAASEPPASGDSPFLIFFAAVTFSAWYGGLGPGLVSTVLATIFSAVFFLSPVFSLSVADLGNQAPIYACGVIGLGGERRLTRQAMRRCYEHLLPGGRFAFGLTARWNDRPAYVSRLPENRHALPEDWPSSTERQLLSDGTELEIAARTIPRNV
jgi:hypothetical protein